MSLSRIWTTAISTGFLLFIGFASMPASPASAASNQCLACHGETLAEPVAQAIDRLYPEDQARGYQPGDLRGAFTITWPAD